MNDGLSNLIKGLKIADWEKAQLILEIEREIESKCDGCDERKNCDDCDERRGEPMINEGYL